MANRFPKFSSVTMVEVRAIIERLENGEVPSDAWLEIFLRQLKENTVIGQKQLSVFVRQFVRTSS